MNGEAPAGMKITATCCEAAHFDNDDNVAIDYNLICNSGSKGFFFSVVLLGSFVLAAIYGAQQF